MNTLNHPSAERPWPVAIDIETTGLVAHQDHVLEIAVVLLDPELNVVEHFGSRVVHVREHNLDERMNDFVRTMHTSNGLLDEVAASTRTLLSVELEIVEWLQAHGLGHKQGIILGSSCRLDLNIIETQMPRLAGLLSHRMIDVSGVREALRLYEPDLDLVSYPAGTTGQSHRAMDDILWTIEEARTQRAAICHQTGEIARLTEEYQRLTHERAAAWTKINQLEREAPHKYDEDALVELIGNIHAPLRWGRMPVDEREEARTRIRALVRDLPLATAE